MVDVRNDGVDIRSIVLKLGNTLMNVGNDGVGIYDITMNVGNDHMHGNCKFSLAVHG